jgi:hypothetical protein
VRFLYQLVLSWTGQSGTVPETFSESLHRRAQRTSDESYVGSWGIEFIILKVVQILEELVSPSPCRTVILRCLALSRVVRYLQPQ